ncbi:MAG: hypothetical protein ACM3WP_25530 [Acidobacteriota bacterium]
MVSTKVLSCKFGERVELRASLQGSVCSLLLLLGVFVCASSPFANAGTCPSGNNTIDPDGTPQTIANVGVTGPITGAITSCFYASQATGADTNTGADEAHPWKHVPGMSGCTGTCGSHSPAAGEAFILRGGDTWTATADMNGLISLWSGTSTHPIYWGGGDRTWFNSAVCGASWCRPIFNANSVTTNNMFHMVNESWNIMDNIEVKGMRNDINGCQNSGGAHIRCTQLYFHGWSHTGNSNNVGFFAQCGAASMIDHNVMDGADSSKNTMNGVYSYCAGTVQYNYFNYVVSGILASVDNVNNNIIENSIDSIDGDHCNGIFTFGPQSGSTLYVFNNMTRKMQCSGGVNFWLVGNSGGCAGCTSYAYNNIIDASAVSGNVFNIGGHPTDGNTGTYTVYNNTIIANNGGTCMGNGEPSPRSTTNFGNNHCIGGSTLCDATGTTCNNMGGNILQAISVANGQGYTSTESLEYSPASGCTSSTCSTLQAGVNLTSSCSGNMASLCNAITYPTYYSSSHTMGMGAVKGRPTSGAWDIGAYQYASASGSLLNPPTGLAAFVQ